MAADTPADSDFLVMPLGLCMIMAAATKWSSRTTPSRPAYPQITPSYILHTQRRRHAQSHEESSWNPVPGTVLALLLGFYVLAWPRIGHDCQAFVNSTGLACLRNFCSPLGTEHTGRIMTPTVPSCKDTFEQATMTAISDIFNSMARAARTLSTTAGDGLDEAAEEFQIARRHLRAGDDDSYFRHIQQHGARGQDAVNYCRRRSR
ncbi:hypothetical protein JKP88DRAFT_251692 [Tribonema minus]|uniref:Uncharacterized protein n=1 Tax=Tribonema minus TaxID=303371 RepID=A0A835ZHF4_9STRA|nr:hypothetical protein JKP88DRAFT_251692 [Tribonema minus]